LHIEVLNNLHSSKNIIRMIESRRVTWAGRVTHVGEKRNAYRILVRKPVRKRPLGRPSHRWVANFKVDLKEKGRCMDCIRLGRDGVMLCSCERHSASSGSLGGRMV
jgi:hypothetical protein